MRACVFAAAGERRPLRLLQEYRMGEAGRPPADYLMRHHLRSANPVFFRLSYFCFLLFVLYQIVNLHLVLQSVIDQNNFISGTLPIGSLPKRLLDPALLKNSNGVG